LSGGGGGKATGKKKAVAKAEAPPAKKAKACTSEPEEPQRGKAAKSSAPEPRGGQGSGTKRFNPPTEEASVHYEISEDGRRAISKGGEINCCSTWTALGGVLAVGEAVAFKMLDGEAAGLVGLAPAPTYDCPSPGGTPGDSVWTRYHLEGQDAIGNVQGSIGLSFMGNIKFNSNQGPSDLAGFGAGDVIELRRLDKRLFRWSKNGEVVIEHEAPDMIWSAKEKCKVANDIDSLCWGVSASFDPEDDTAIWEIVDTDA